MIEDFAIGVELSKRPLNQRLDFDFIRSEMEAELEIRDIRTPFQLELRSDNDILYSFANQDNHRPFRGASYSTPLFRGDLNHSMGYMAIYFPNKHQELLGNVAVMLGSSIALLLVLVSAFTFTILTILRQKKISEMKTDFINNMTHEFKTPVATIMIASETLMDPDITEDKKGYPSWRGLFTMKMCGLATTSSGCSTSRALKKKT